MFNSNLLMMNWWITLNFTLKVITLPSCGHILFSMLKIIHAFMTSTLDFSNALLSGCPAGSINKLQLVQNAAGKVLARANTYDNISPILLSLHRLPVTPTLSLNL